MIFVGANDGMLHAFKDCDGSEAWAFIPPDLLPVLKYLGPTGNAHTYYIDFSPTIYTFDADKDGNIETGDKVILLFGLRRGGGITTAPISTDAAGYLYALDITNPLQPIFLMSIDKTQKRVGTTTTPDTTTFSELTETWGDISYGRIRLASGMGTVDKIVAFIGGGYNNCYEDARYGNTTYYTGSCVGALATADTGTVTSGGSTYASSLSDAVGRGIYVVEIATLDSAVPHSPDFSAGGTLIKSFTHADTSYMNYSFPSRLATVDINFDGAIDVLYAGDTGGRLWRIWIGDSSTTNWNATRIFRANPGYAANSGAWIPPTSENDTNGRKIFYEPAAFVQADGSVRLYFGTGDREHPLNEAVADRMYGVIDKGQTTTKYEYDLVDVTEDLLQAPGTSTATISNIISALTDPDRYGWYIRLDQNSGEKVLAPATVFDQKVIFTTYSPNVVAAADPCSTGNLGASRAYVLNYLTGEAVINFDTTNDATSTSNDRAMLGSAYIGRSDRVVNLGGGIPSGAVVVTSQTGQTSIMIGVGGSIMTFSVGGGQAASKVYWRKKSE